MHAFIGPVGNRRSFLVHIALHHRVISILWFLFNVTHFADRSNRWNRWRQKEEMYFVCVCVSRKKNLKKMETNGKMGAGKKRKQRKNGITCICLKILASYTLSIERKNMHKKHFWASPEKKTWCVFQTTRRKKKLHRIGGRWKPDRNNKNKSKKPANRNIRRHIHQWTLIFECFIFFYERFFFFFLFFSHNEEKHVCMKSYVLYIHTHICLVFFMESCIPSRTWCWHCDVRLNIALETFVHLHCANFVVSDSPWWT